MAETLGEKIKKARCLAGLTQEDLANKVGLTGKMVISRFENGARRPDFETVVRIAEATNCPLLWFASKEEEPVREPEEIELLTLFGLLTLDGREHVLKCLHCTYAAEEFWSASMRAEA